MGAAFALASSNSDVVTASPDVVAVGMRTTFALAALLVGAALAVAGAVPRHAARSTG
jgi:hypothetical protein